MKYFRILADDQQHAERWFLDEPTTADGEIIDPRCFTDAKVYAGPEPAIIPIQQQGHRVQFNFASFDMPVVAEGVWKQIKPLIGANAQFYSVRIGPQISGYGILNILTSTKCLDEKQTEVQRWTAEDGRPELIGQYLGLTNITIDQRRTSGNHMFRIKGWEIALIVSEIVRDRLIRFEQLGLVFSPV